VLATIERAEDISTNDGHGHVTKRLLVIYSYSVDGVRYTTDRVTSRGNAHGSLWAEHVARQFHSGQSVTAYVGTTDPGSAFLVRDHDWRVYALVAFPLVVAIGLAIYWPWAGIQLR